MKITLLLLLSITYTNLYSQNIETETGLRNTFSAYGYLLGQEYCLKKIKADFPDLYPTAIEAELAFKNSFGNAKENIETIFSAKYSSEKLNEIKKQIIQDFQKLSINTIDSSEKATIFIDEVKNRSKGKIDSPIREYIFFYAFYKKPEQEFLRGYIQKFDTKGHIKSKGSDFTIKVPISWVAFEADRPNIIQKFISEGGYGNESIMLIIKEFPTESPISKEEINNLFTEKEAKEMIPSDAVYIDFQKMTFDGVDGGLLEYELTQKRLDFEIISQVSQFMLIYNQKFYFLTCSIGSLSKDKSSSDKEKFKNLFKLVANSIVINEQYKK